MPWPIIRQYTYLQRDLGSYIYNLVLGVCKSQGGLTVAAPLEVCGKLMGVGGSVCFPSWHETISWPFGECCSSIHFDFLLPLLQRAGIPAGEDAEHKGKRMQSENGPPSRDHSSAAFSVTVALPLPICLVHPSARASMRRLDWIPQRRSRTMSCLCLEWKLVCKSSLLLTKSPWIV